VATESPRLRQTVDQTSSTVCMQAARAHVAGLEPQDRALRGALFLCIRKCRDLDETPATIFLLSPLATRSATMASRRCLFLKSVNSTFGLYLLRLLIPSKLHLPCGFWLLSQLPISVTEDTVHNIIPDTCKSRMFLANRYNECLTIDHAEFRRDQVVAGRKQNNHNLVESTFMEDELLAWQSTLFS
jgi:hypothetical protein